jgi:hypothetical protein
MSRARRDESGAILVISVICLVVLLGVTALVVDIGIAFSQRRTMQSSADASSLGGAQDLAGAGTTSAIADAVTVGAENIPKRTINWNACGGDALPAGYRVLDATHNCMSFSSDFERLRVRVPRQTFPSVFGKILGFSSTSTSTVAIAGLKFAGNGGGLEPFAIDSTFGSGDYCLDSGGNGNSVAPCDGATTGNFGLLSFAHCGINSGLLDDIAAGADHVYTANPPDSNGNYAADIPDDCTVFGPNTVLSDPGNRVDDAPALLNQTSAFSDGKPARLQRLPSDCSVFSPAWEAVNSACGSTGAIDNRPIWEFIPETTLPGIPNECQRKTFDDALAALSGQPVDVQRTTMHAAVLACITAYKNAGASAPVFTAATGGVVDQGLPLFDIQMSPRFIYVPQVRQPQPVNGRKTYQILEFRAVFIQRTGANNSSSFFEPGPWNNTLPDNSAADVSGFVLPAPRAGCTPTDTDSCGTMLPGLLGSIGPTPVVIGGNAVVELFG